jgi:hypothetical protein
LRLLWLQRKVRPSAVSRQKEAAVLLARAAVETCLLGRYCLVAANPVTPLQSDYGKRMFGLMADMVEELGIPREFLDGARAAMFPTSERPAVMSVMAEAIENGSSRPGALDLYHRFYQPTSMFFVHANAASLLRHVRADNSLGEQPTVPWTRRAAVRITDASVGLLALEIAELDGRTVDLFETYAVAHLSRTMPPLTVFVGRGLRSSLQWSKVPAAVRAFRELRTYYHAGKAAADAPDVRRARTRQGLEVMLEPLGLVDVPADVVDGFKERMVDLLVTDADR